MRTKLKNSYKIIITLLSIPLAFGLFWLSIQAHVKIYKWIYPNRNTEYEQNIYFDEQLELHLMFGLPLLYVISFFLVRFLLKSKINELS